MKISLMLNFRGITMYFKNEVTDELNEISANFDPLLNWDILKIISLRETLLTNRRQKNVGLLCVVYGDNLVDLDEFEQALI